MDQLNKVEKLYSHALNVEPKKLCQIIEKLCKLSKSDAKDKHGYYLRFDVNKLKDIFLSSNFIMKELELIPEIIDIICEYCKSSDLCWCEEKKSKFIRIIYTNPDIATMDVIDKHNANISYAIIGKRQNGIWANSIVTEKPILLKDDYGRNNTFFRFIFRVFVTVPNEYYQACIGIVQKDCKMQLSGSTNSALFGFEGKGESFCFHWSDDLSANFYYSGHNMGKKTLKRNLRNIEPLHDDKGDDNKNNNNNDNNNKNDKQDPDEVKLDGYFVIEIDLDKNKMKVVCIGLIHNSMECNIPQKLLDVIQHDQCFNIGLSYVAPHSSDREPMFIGVGLC